MTYRVPEADQRMASVDRMRANHDSAVLLARTVTAPQLGFPAKWSGTCIKCKRAIVVGQYIARSRIGMSPVGYSHTVCPAVDAPKPLAPRVEPVGLDLNVLPLGTLHVAVPNESGKLTFMVIDRPSDGKWLGWTFVRQFLGGQGPAQRLGSQRPGVNARYFGQWESLLEKVLIDPRSAAERFASELGTCYVCNRDLTDEPSRAAGIGPICAAKTSW